jgi:hypothetical protein
VHPDHKGLGPNANNANDDDDDDDDDDNNNNNNNNHKKSIKWQAYLYAKISVYK